MENGVGVVDGAQLGERKGVEEEVRGSTVEEMPMVKSNELKESEGDDEVYEEAIAGDTLRVGFEKRVVSDGGNDEKLEGLDAGDEAEKFEEAIGVPSDDRKNEPSEEGLLSEQRTSPDGDLDEKSNGTGDNEKRGPVSVELQNSDHLHFDETPSCDTVADVTTDQQGDHGHEPLGTQNANEVKGGNTGLLSEVESNGDVFHQNNKDSEENESHGVMIAGCQNDKFKQLENASPGLSSEPLNHSAEEQDGIPTSMAKGNQDFDDKPHEVALTHSVSATEHQERSPRQQNDLQPPFEEKAENSEFERSFPSEDSAVEKSEKLGVSSAGLLAESLEGTKSQLPETTVDNHEAMLEEPENKDEHKETNQAILQRSADFVAESSGGSQHGLVDLNAKVSESALKEPEKKHKDEEYVEMNQSIMQNEDEDVRPAANASATARSSRAPHPAGLGHFPLGTREQQVKPAADIPSSSLGSATSAPVPPRPAGLGRAAPLLEPAPRVAQQPRVNGTVSPVQNQLVEEPTSGEADETDETREKLQMIRVKFLRLAHRLGQTPHNVVVAQVLYRLGLAEQLRGRNGSRVAAFSFDRASAMAEQLEAAGQEPLDFSCTIMVLGKTGVGKSATINSIFDEIKFGTDAFQLGTKKVQDVVGTVQGIKVRVIDTPGLLPSWSDQRKNEKVLQSVKQYIKRTPPDIILYLDRLDMPSREFSDMPLLRTITEIFGPSIWFNAIVVLTHAASAPPEGPNGTTTSYDMFVTQRSHVVQQAIRQAAGDMRLMNPVSLVENHSACRTNRAGQRVLPNGQVWKPHLLLLSFASKILAEANTLLKLQDSPPGKPFAPRTRSPPLPFLLSSLLQSRPPVKLPVEQFGDDNDSLDDDLDESSDSEDESEYDQLPPFKGLTKAQLAKLPRAQRKAYYDELEYRERLFMKKQLKEEKKRRKMMKKMQAAANDIPTEYRENVEEESGGAASVPVPMPDLALPASFDSDNPTHRYRYLDSTNQWLVRPVLEPNGWDHDVGYEGINAERLFVVKEKLPISFSGQISKDKKDTSLQMEVASTVKHGEGKATSVGFDLQSVGKDIAYTLRSETRFSNWRKNKAVAGFSVTLLGDILTGGFKVEDKLIINKQGQLVVSAGAIMGRGDVAYGGSLEATLRDKDHPLGRFLTTLGLSVMDWHGDLAIGCNLQSQIPVGRTSNLIGRVNVNNRGSGQVSIRVNSSDHLQIVLISFVPLVRKLLSYYQPVQYG